MFTTGTKLLVGAAVLATVGAVAYGVTQDGVMGTVGLISAAVALAYLAGTNAVLRDSNVSAMDVSAVQTSAASRPAPGASAWPLGLAVGSVAIVLGLVTQQSIFVIGVIIVLAAGVQWMVQAWSERASADPAHNALVRERFSNPIEFPLLGAVGIGTIVYAFSRVMLWLSKTNTVIAFAVLATVVLLAAFAFAYRRTLTTGVIGGVVAVAAIAIVATGVAAGVDGQRDIHVFETVELLQEEEGICSSTEHFEADEDASQTVAAKSNVFAEIVLTAEGRLAYDFPGGNLPSGDVVTIPRSNPSNIIFRNESDHERRLSIDLGTEEIESENGEAEVHPRQECTSLVGEGGAQLLTLTIGEPSALHEGGYRFFVPGVDTAELEVVVP